MAERPTPQSDANDASNNAEALLKRLEWTVIRRLDGLLQGDYRTLWRGAGLDLADLREYQHHDGARSSRCWRGCSRATATGSARCCTAPTSTP
jgi:hypothetical protein